MTLFWHYSALVDELRNADPASTPCYGDPNYAGKVNIELGGLTYGEYKALTDPVLGLIDQYAAALQALQAAQAQQDETAINKALLDLGQLLKDNPDLAKYDKYRDYAPGHIPENKLLGIDKCQVDCGDDNNNSSDLDKGPNTTEDAAGNNDSKGPNYRYGRRNWIDIRQ